MAGAAGIKAGKIFVEASLADDGFRAALKRAEASFRAFGKSVNKIGKGFTDFGASLAGAGKKLGAVGALAASPFALATKSFATYEDALASLRSAANPTADELKKIESAVADISASTGAGPAQVAQAMTELLKAGAPLESVLDGVAEAAVKFAKVAEMDTAEAVTVLTDAMNVFGNDVTTTMDTLTRAADASSISVKDVTDAFTMVGAVAKQAGLGIGDVAGAIAVLGQNGVKGSDAGTSLKTMLLRLQTGAESAGEEMAKLGIDVRNSDGSMKDMRGIIGELETKLAGLSGQAKDQALLKLFGSDAIRAGAILIGKGVKGLDEFGAAMQKGLPVSEKFGILMDTLSGHAQKALAALERLGVAVGKALAPAFGKLAGWVSNAADVATKWASENGEIVLLVGKLAAGAVAAGLAVAGLGEILSTAGAVLGGLGSAFIGLAGAAAAVLSPVGLLTAAAVGGVVAWLRWTDSGKAAVAFLGSSFAALKADALAAFGGIAAALKGGDVNAAAKILWATLRVESVKGLNLLRGLWADWGVGAVNTFESVGFSLAKALNRVWGEVRKQFETLTSDLFGSWASLAARMVKSFIPLAGLFDKLGVDLEGPIAGALAGLGVTAGGRADRKKELDQKTTEIDAGTAATDKALTEDQDRRAQGRIDAARNGVVTGKGDLAAAEADLKAALDAAKPKPGQAKTPAELAKERIDAKLAGLSGEAPGAGAGRGLAAGAEGLGKERMTPEGLDDALEKSAARVDVKGSFNAAAARGLGAGDSVRDLTDEAKRQTKWLEKIDERLRKSGGLVANEP